MALVGLVDQHKICLKTCLNLVFHSKIFTGGRYRYVELNYLKKFFFLMALVGLGLTKAEFYAIKNQPSLSCREFCENLKNGIDFFKN